MSRFLDEIRQLPDALGRLIDFYRTDGRAVLQAWSGRMAGRDQILFAGMGTSHFAPLAIRPHLATAGIACNVIDAGEWLHYGCALPGDRGQVVLVSQSGESVEVKHLIEQDKVGHHFVGVVNNLDSTLGRAAGLLLPMCAGDEAAISTKTYTNTLALLHLMAVALQGMGQLDRALDDLSKAADCLQSTREQAIIDAADLLLPADALAFVARGPAHVTARQCALTFMEGARLLAAPFTAGAFRHGPFESAGPDLRAVIFLPDGPTRTITEGLGREAAEHGAHVVFVTDADLAEGPNIKVIRLQTIAADSREDLFPLIASAAHPLLLHHLAKARGFEAGQFRYGGKVTTRQ